MSNYKYKDNCFIIEDYDQQKPFASFLPGVAGVNGIPMWTYYTNRGQGIAGFGVENKDGAILDIVPANVAYRRTELQGFRTFIKVNEKVHEIFSSSSKDDYTRNMEIEANAVRFVEINKTLGLKIKASFFTVTDKAYPGLVRKLEVSRLTDRVVSVEIIDGLMTLWPYKNDNNVTKNLANLAVAWFEAYNTENNMPFFRNRSTTEDSATVGKIEAGHFYAAFSNKNNKPMPVIYDPDILFGNYTGILEAKNFMMYSADDLLDKEQVSANKLPCAFSVYSGQIEEDLVISSIVGKLNNVEELIDLQDVFSVEYFNQLEVRAKELGETLTKDVDSKTAYPMFDAYVKQSYLDNLLRGGYPLVFEGKDGPIVYHVYSRIHGDMEREYNDFYVEPAYYSHGVGNFRDVNQNRRNDVFFVKEAGLFNIKQFMELLQVDGQNPLSIKGSKLSVSKSDIASILAMVENNSSLIEEILASDFTPGSLLKTIDDYDISLNVTKDIFIKNVIKMSSQENHAGYGHGFWVDHWTYNMDLVDHYLNVYPDKLNDLCYKESLKYFVSPDVVLPRRDKYVLREDGEVRQYDAIYRDENRMNKLKLDGHSTEWQKRHDGSIYESNLVTKLLTLTMNKITNLDPSGLGIMMNSDKPGWNDAMNGLPGLFGSGVSEVVELNRVVNFLMGVISKNDSKIAVTKELSHLIESYLDINRHHLSQNETWQATQDVKEVYLESILYGVSEDIDYESEEILHLLNMISQQIENSINNALDLGNGILPTFIVHKAVDYQIIKDKYHPVNGMQNVKVTAWQKRLLPNYLEAPARYLKQIKDVSSADSMFKKIKESGMYDKSLKMYVTSESLDNESLEIGRARAFTAGWLERESVFMHMEYKYLLGLLKSGLYTEYYDSIKTAFPPFLDPEIYGRSTLENSSFIASSRNPNKANHGRGFVSRLTGTTAELITMWLYMMTGMKMFTMDPVLKFELKPTLTSDFFDNGRVQFMIFGKTDIEYINPKNLDTFGDEGVSVESYQLLFNNGESLTLTEVIGDNALAIRSGEVHKIRVSLS